MESQWGRLRILDTGLIQGRSIVPACPNVRMRRLSGKSSVGKGHRQVEEERGGTSMISHMIDSGVEVSS